MKKLRKKLAAQLRGRQNRQPCQAYINVQIPLPLKPSWAVRWSRPAAFGLFIASDRYIFISAAGRPDGAVRVIERRARARARARAPAPAPLTNIRAPGALAAAILAGEGLIAKGNSIEKREQQWRRVSVVISAHLWLGRERCLTTHNLEGFSPPLDLWVVGLKITEVVVNLQPHPTRIGKFYPPDWIRVKGAVTQDWNELKVVWLTRPWEGKHWKEPILKIGIKYS